MPDQADDEQDEMAIRLPESSTRGLDNLFEDLVRDLTEREEQTILEKQRREELEKTDPRDLN